ncbi:MAG: diguanylate cyclase, partial [Methylococcales bacterium]|nr:diguanylate cyclase [Methylococcales bacterium]
MRRCSLKYRIAITIFLLELIVMAVVLRVTISYIGDEMRAEFSAAHSVVQTLLIDMSEVALITDDFVEFQGRVAVIVGDPKVDTVLLADLNERVVVSSDLELIGAQISSIPGKDERLVLPVMFGKQKAGQLEIQFNTELLAEKLSDAQILGAIIALVGMVIVAMVSLLMGYLLTKRLQLMISAATSVAQGSLTVKVPASGNDELGRLGSVFNSMVSKLRQQVGELKDQKQYLQDSNVALSSEVSLKKVAEESLRQEKEKVHVTLEALGDGVITTDLEGYVDYLNPVAIKILNVIYSEVLGQPLDRIYQRSDLVTHVSLRSVVLDCLEEKGQASSGDVLLNIGTHDDVVVQESAAAIKDYHGNVIGCVVVFRDMTQARLLEDEISYQATHDDLTGLINRREFEVRLTHLLKVTRKLDIEAAVLYLDLDQFKVVNETFGHVAGDELLQVLSTVLRGNLGDKDSLARLGGDEFGVILIDRDENGAMLVADQLRDAVKSFRFVWDDQFFTVGVSIGVIPLTTT